METFTDPNTGITWSADRLWWWDGYQWRPAYSKPRSQKKLIAGAACLGLGVLGIFSSINVVSEPDCYDGCPYGAFAPTVILIVVGSALLAWHYFGRPKQ